MTVKTQRIFFTFITVVMFALVVSSNNTDMISKKAFAFLFPQSSSVSSLQNSSSSAMHSSISAESSSSLHSSRSSSTDSSSSSVDNCAGKIICTASSGREEIITTNGRPGACPAGCTFTTTSYTPCYNVDDPGELVTGPLGNQGYAAIGDERECIKIPTCCQTTLYRAITTPDGDEITVTDDVTWHFVTSDSECTGQNQMLVNAVCCEESEDGIPPEQNSCT